MIQKTRGRDRAEDVSLSARKHSRQDMSGDVYVGHDVDFPDLLPIGVRGFGASRDRDARVRAEDVEPALLRLDLLDESLDVSLVGNIAANRGAFDLLRDRTRALVIEVGNDHRATALRGETQGQGATDAARCARHHDDPTPQLHRKLVNLCT